MSQFRPAKKRVEVSVALERLCKNLRAFYTQTYAIILDRRKRRLRNTGALSELSLAKALQLHPAVLVFPGWETQLESAA